MFFSKIISDKLREVKASMNKLLDEVSQHTNDAMSGDKVFIHRTIETDKSKSSYEYNVFCIDGCQ